MGLSAAPLPLQVSPRRFAAMLFIDQNARDMQTMRALSIVAAIAVLVLSALTLLPETGAYHAILSMAATACAAVTLVAIFATGPRGGKDRTSLAAPAGPAPVEAARPVAPPPSANQADAEVVNLLATLQRKGRFIDFLMDDIAAYSDAQVGAAARVVHDGCASALKDHMRIRPVREENEGTRIEVPAGFAADEYRLVGRIGGEPPFAGTLVHRGWRAEAVNLPRLLNPDDDRLPTIAPAEVELK